MTARTVRGKSFRKGWPSKPVEKGNTSNQIGINEGVETSRSLLEFGACKRRVSDQFSKGLRYGSAQIWMSTEEYAEQIPCLPLVPNPRPVLIARYTGIDSPISTPKDSCRSGHMVHLIRICLHPNSALLFHAQQMIHHLEPILSLGIIHAAHVHEELELTLTVVPQESQDGDDTRGGNVQGQLVFEDGELLDVFWETLSQVRAICMQCL